MKLLTHFNIDLLTYTSSTSQSDDLSRPRLRRIRNVLQYIALRWHGSDAMDLYVVRPAGS